MWTSAISPDEYDPDNEDFGFRAAWYEDLLGVEESIGAVLTLIGQIN
ncbi:hypothetical protein [Streptosporangium sp. NPDC006930]